MATRSTVRASERERRTQQQREGIFATPAAATTASARSSACLSCFLHFSQRRKRDRNQEPNARQTETNFAQTKRNMKTETRQGFDLTEYFSSVETSFRHVMLHVDTSMPTFFTYKLIRTQAILLEIKLRPHIG